MRHLPADPRAIGDVILEWLTAGGASGRTSYVVDLQLAAAADHDDGRGSNRPAALRLVLPVPDVGPGGRHEPGLGPVVCVGDLRIEASARVVRVGGAAVATTGVEFDVLRLLVEEAGRAVSRDRLSRQVLDRPFDPADRSIDIHVSKLRRKLGPHPGGGTRIRAVRGVGYVYALSS